MKAGKVIRLACLLAASGCGADHPETDLVSSAGPMVHTRPAARETPAPAAAAPAAETTKEVIPPAPPPPPPPAFPAVSWVPLPPPPPPADAKAEPAPPANVLRGDVALKEIIKRAELIERTEVRFDDGSKTVQVDYKDGSRSFHKTGPAGSGYEFQPAR